MSTYTEASAWTPWTRGGGLLALPRPAERVRPERVRPEQARPEQARLEPALPVHLTRRGRALLVVALVALLSAAFCVGRSASQAATAQGPVPPLPQTTVQTGDTLWSVAKRAVPGRDPRDVVARIRELNHLQGAALRVGQQLVLPRAG